VKRLNPALAELKEILKKDAPAVAAMIAIAACVAYLCAALSDSLKDAGSQEPQDQPMVVVGDTCTCGCLRRD